MRRKFGLNGFFLKPGLNQPAYKDSPQKINLYLFHLQNFITTFDLLTGNFL